MSSEMLDRQEFRRCCGKFASGVTIATVSGCDGLPHGITVSSFTPASLEPPLILICVDIRAQFLKHVSEDSYLGINILREDQPELSRKFSRIEAERFSGVRWYAGTCRVPLLLGSLATLECRLSHMVYAGDHAVLISQSICATYSDGDPLVYFNGCYRKLQWEHLASRSQEGYISGMDWSLIVE